MYYECTRCQSQKKPKKTGMNDDMEIVYQCKKCGYQGGFEDFLPQDEMKFLFI